jgi:hypothetical protein
MVSLSHSGHPSRLIARQCDLCYSRAWAEAWFIRLNSGDFVCRRSPGRNLQRCIVGSPGLVLIRGGSPPMYSLQASSRIRGSACASSKRGCKSAVLSDDSNNTMRDSDVSSNGNGSEGSTWRRSSHEVGRFCRPCLPVRETCCRRSCQYKMSLRCLRSMNLDNVIAEYYVRRVIA